MSNKLSKIIIIIKTCELNEKLNEIQIGLKRIMKREKKRETVDTS